MDEILLALLKKEKMWYQEIVDLGIRRKDARIRLNVLVRRRLVREEGRTRKDQRGKKLFYSLTTKGRAECLYQSIEDMNASIKVLRDISNAILSNPSQTNEFREKSRQAFLKIEIAESMPLKERVVAVSTETKRIYGPLKEAYSAMHRLMTQLMTPKTVRDQEFFIGFTKQGAIHMIPRVVLERLELEIP